MQELERKLAEYLNVEYLLLVNNGTMALDIAYRALEVDGLVITTPFTFAATTSSICWQHNTPVFADISSESFTLDIASVDDKTLSLADAIVPVHVFGHPCQVDEIAAVAKKHNCKVIYDAAHAFATTINNRSVLAYGDAATLSFHATKLFHTVEGGAVVFKDKAVYEKAKLLVNFGLNSQQVPEFIGTNGKLSEVHAAMGLTNLTFIDALIKHRQQLKAAYYDRLNTYMSFQTWQANVTDNGAYMPVLLKNEAELLHVINVLAVEGIQARRYFYPSLSLVESFGQRGVTPIANDIASRIMCLPLYADLQLTDVKLISDMLINVIKQYRGRTTT
ncbi:aminotransferase DegT [Thalassotalea marina]|uniref:Aminotransferase DegT n=1 Tax=Thalassotalea marina TaxID=1673741 RepID=A0A919BBL8_9GAMM|nr:aminotransferase DegT [Thalassotalea marina]